jgi:hypothetical protein
VAAGTDGTTGDTTVEVFEFEKFPIDPDFPTSTESLTNINLSVNGQASGSRQDQTNTKKRIDIV